MSQNDAASTWEDLSEEEQAAYAEGQAAYRDGLTPTEAANKCPYQTPGDARGYWFMVAHFASWKKADS